MGRVSAFSYWDKHSHNSYNNYLLLDSATSVHVFYDKNRFINFRKAIKDQKLLYGTDTLAIEDWEKISLPLRIGNRTSILILKEVAYVSNFPLNLVSLTYLEDEGYRWYHWSGEIITKNTSRIIISILK